MSEERIVRVFRVTPKTSYEVGVLCDSVEQGEEFVSWHSGQIALEHSGDYHGCEVEHLPEDDGAYAADYDTEKPPADGLSYTELLKLARDLAEGLLTSALWDLHYSDQADKDVERSIEFRSDDCRKLGLNPDIIRAEFDKEHGLTDEDDESEDE